MEQQEILDMMSMILVKHGKPAVVDIQDELRGIGFRSLDFSELALRVERKAGRELNFDAALMRSIRTVADVLNFFEDAVKNA